MSCPLLRRLYERLRPGSVPLLSILSEARFVLTGNCDCPIEQIVLRKEPHEGFKPRHGIASQVRVRRRFWNRLPIGACGEPTARWLAANEEHLNAKKWAARQAARLISRERWRKGIGVGVRRWPLGLKHVDD